MTLEEMRQALSDMLIKYDYNATKLSREIGIDQGSMKLFIMGVSKPNKNTLSSLILFFKRVENRKWNKDRTFRGKKRMERIDL